LQFESNIYWTDWYNKSVYRSQRVPRMGYSYPFEVRDALSGALDIRAVSLQRQGKSWNQCAQDNGGCSHLCFYRAIDYVCACPDRLESDRRECSTTPKELVQARLESDQQPDYSDELTDDTTSTENQDNNNNQFDDDLKSKEDNEREFFVLIALGVVIVMVVIIMLVMFSKAK